MDAKRIIAGVSFVVLNLAVACLFASVEEVDYITKEDAIAGNLVLNGGFEEVDSDGWPTGWGKGTYAKCFSIDTASFVSGKGSWKVYGKTPLQYASGNTFAVEGGKAYTLIYWVKQAGMADGAPGSRIEIRWNMRDGTYFFDHDLRRWSPFDWQECCHTVVSPEGAASASIYLQCMGKYSEVWYDDVVFARGFVSVKISEMGLKELALQYSVYENMTMDLERFMCFKGRHIDKDLRDEMNMLFVRIGGLKDIYAKELSVKGVVGKRLERLMQEACESQSVMAKGGYRPLVDGHHQDWQAIEGKVTDFKAKVDGYLKRELPGRIGGQARSVYGKDMEYGVGVVTSMQKVLKYAPYLGDIGNSAAIEMAGNEHEGVQVVVVGLEKALKGVRVSVSDLKSDDGDVLSRDAISVYPVGYINTVDPLYPVDHVGWWPDPLMKDEFVDVEVGANQSFWIDVHAMAGTEAGTYKGDITVKPTNSKAVKVGFEVKVWGFEIPHRGKFKVIGRFAKNELKKFYGWKKVPKDIELAWNLFQVEHRYNPSDMYATDVTPDGEVLEACLKAGLNSVVVMNISQLLERDELKTYQPMSGELKKRVAGQLRRTAGILKKYDALDTGYIFGFDEYSNVQRYPFLAEVFGFAKSIVPEFKTAATISTPPLDKLAPAIDAWIPLLGRKIDHIYGAKNDDAEMFFYIYGTPKHPFPNGAVLDYPAIDGRMMYWLAAKHDWTGFLHWLVNGFGANSKTEKRWPEVDWIPYSDSRYSKRNGEGYLIYPGPDGSPLSSIRFENIRDGIEDWEMIRMLKDRIDGLDKGDSRRVSAKAAIKAIDGLVPTDYKFDTDPKQILKVRAMVADELEKLSL